jgi:hypothetical protein
VCGFGELRVENWGGVRPGRRERKWVQCSWCVCVYGVAVCGCVEMCVLCVRARVCALCACVCACVCTRSGCVCVYFERAEASRAIFLISAHSTAMRSCPMQSCDLLLP